MSKLRGDYNVPGTSLLVTFDHRRDDYQKGHGLHCHVKKPDSPDRIASISLETFSVMAGSLPGGKEERILWDWIQSNASMLIADAEYWRDNGAYW